MWSILFVNSKQLIIMHFFGNNRWRAWLFEGVKIESLRGVFNLEKWCILQYCDSEDVLSNNFWPQCHTWNAWVGNSGAGLECASVTCGDVMETGIATMALMNCIAVRTEMILDIRLWKVKNVFEQKPSSRSQGKSTKEGFTRWL